MGIVLAIPDGTYEIIQDDYSDLANLIRERLGAKKQLAQT